MKNPRHHRSMFFLLTAAILVSTWGAQRAHADTASEFTGTWTTYNVGPFGNDQSTGGVIFSQFGADGATDAYFTTNPVTVGTLNTCTSYPCNQNYSGTFVGGTMPMFIGDDANPAFTATITGGTYSGFDDSSAGYYPYYSVGDEITFTFTGLWANGWTSVGTFNGYFQLDGSEPNDFGTLTMTTTTAPSAVPEPGSITLLGSGIVLAVAFLRRRLWNPSPVI